MTDIYRQELAIPEKRRVFGWLMLIGGGLMLVIALFLYSQEAHQVKTYVARPWEEPTTQNQVSQNKPTDLKTKLDKSKPLIWIVIASVIAFILFLIGATLNHRLAMRLRKSNKSKKQKTTLGDPWQEAGQKLELGDSDIDYSSDNYDE